MSANRKGNWPGLLLALGIGLAILALDLLWLLDYLEHEQVRSAGRRLGPTVTGGTAIAQILIWGAMGVGIVAMALYFIFRKLKK